MKVYERTLRLITLSVAISLFLVCNAAWADSVSFSTQASWNGTDFYNTLPLATFNGVTVGFVGGSNPGITVPSVDVNFGQFTFSGSGNINQFHDFYLKIVQTIPNPTDGQVSVFDATFKGKIDQGSGNGDAFTVSFEDPVLTIAGNPFNVTYSLMTSYAQPALSTANLNLQGQVYLADSITPENGSLALPEPGSLLLLTTGLVGVAFVFFGRKRQSDSN